MNRSQHPFTLTEIIVALGIFSLLMVLMLRFFTGAETLITSGEGRNTTYSDGRVAMDLIASLLRNVQIQDSIYGIPFKLERRSGKVNYSDKIAFYTQSPVRLTSTAKSNFYSVQIEIKEVEPEAGNPQTYTPLIIKVADDQEDLFGKISTESSSTNPDFLAGTEQEVVRYVTGLSFEPYLIETSGSMPEMKLVDADETKAFLASLNGSGDSVARHDKIVPYETEMPNAIEIRLTMLSPENYLRYLALLPDPTKAFNCTDREPENAKQFRLANEVEFTRTVLLPNANVLGE